MFDNNRCMTIGIKNEIPLELQMFMWNCIDRLKDKGIDTDYLQVFKLTKERSDDVFFQKIVHRQEVPPYEKEYILMSGETVEEKIFVIDDSSHSTMLLAREY